MRRVSRHQRLLAAAAPAALLALTSPLIAPPPSASAATRTLHLSGTLHKRGDYLYLRFRVPAHTRRIAATLKSSDKDASFGAGLFDQRGTTYGSTGFRGIY